MTPLSPSSLHLHQTLSWDNDDDLTQSIREWVERIVHIRIRSRVYFSTEAHFSVKFIFALCTTRKELSDEQHIFHKDYKMLPQWWWYEINMRGKTENGASTFIRSLVTDTSWWWRWRLGNLRNFLCDFEWSNDIVNKSFDMMWTVKTLW